MMPSEIPKLPHRPAGEGVSWCLETSSRLSPQDGSPSLTLSSFCLKYFVLPPFEENGLPFWVPGVLHQRSEVVLWYLLSNQMNFWWICGGEWVSPSYSSAIVGPLPAMLSFKSAFSLSSFTLIKRLLSSSLLLAISVVHLHIWGCYFSQQSWFWYYWHH